MAEWVVIGILVSLVGWQQVQIQKLVNKLMSRNYQDFAQGERQRRPLNASTNSRRLDVVDPIAEKNAREATSLFTV